MRLKNSIRFAVFLGVFALTSFSWGAGNPALPSGFGPWQKAKVGEYMTLQIPGKFKVTDVDLSEDVRKKVDSMETYILDNPDVSDYQCIVTYINYNKDIVADLDGAADGAVGNMKRDPNVSDLKATQKYIQRFKLKGIQVDGSFKAEGKLAEFQMVIYSKRNVLWMLMVEDVTDNKLPAVTNAILNSLQIKNP